MTGLIRFVSLVLLLAIVLAGFVFSSFNTEEISLWLGRELAPRPLGHWIVLSFSIGGFIGLFLGYGLFSRLKYRMQIRKLKEEANKARQEVARLRKQPLKDLAK